MAYIFATPIELLQHSLSRLNSQDFPGNCEYRIAPNLRRLIFADSSRTVKIKLRKMFRKMGAAIKNC